MHELSLYGSVPPSKKHLVLSVLAGLTSMQPQFIYERRLHFLPTREPGSPLPPKVKTHAEKSGVPKAFLTDTFRVQIVADVSEDNARRDVAAEGSDFERFGFRCDFKDFPEVPGKRPATSRVFERMNVVQGKRNHMLSFMEGVGFKYGGSEMIESGERFTFGNIDVRLVQTYPLPPSPTPMDIAPKDSSTLKPLDPNGAFVFQAILIVGEDGKPEIMSSAFEEMQQLKETFRGIVDLRIGDRLLMNTRIRRTV